MGILKNKFCENYFKVPNKIFDYALSAGAFQLYCYFCSQKGVKDVQFIITEQEKIIVINKNVKTKLNVKSNHTLNKYWGELLDKELITKNSYFYVMKEL